MPVGADGRPALAEHLHQCLVRLGAEQLVHLRSEAEPKFAEKLEAREDVKFYVKLPNWFKVRTLIGNYNRYWAVVMEEVDQFGDNVERLLLVRQTKSAHNLGEPPPV